MKDKKRLPEDQVEFEEVSEDGAPELGKKIKELREKLEISEREKREYLGGWQRAKADAINREKEVKLERERERKFANESLIEELLAVLDSYEMAKQQISWASVDESWRKGIEYIFSQMYTVLDRNGLKQFGKPGEQFDVTRHESVGEEETRDKDKDHTVIKIIQSGYELGGKVIRSAKVIIGVYK